MKSTSLLTLTALCAAGLEPVAGRELTHLGFRVTEREPGRVSFESDLAGAATALIGLRTVERLMVRMGRFPAQDFDELYEGMRRLPWEDFCGPEDRSVIARLRVRNSALSAQTSIQSVAHKAVYDRLSARYRVARLPETGPEREIRIYLENDLCTVGLDLSGENLSRRGYRLRTVEAPLRETIAAALVLLSAWRRKHPLADLFCGSGTIPIEAALYAMDKAPGLERRFGMESMPCSPRGIFVSAREEARAKVRRDVRVRILGSDTDPEAIAIATENARRAGVSDFVRLQTADMREARPESEDPGFIISNPPYGTRLGSPEEAHAVWEEMAGIRERFPDWTYGFILNDESFPECFGMRPDRAWDLSSGAESLHYFLYRGTATESHVKVQGE